MISSIAPFASAEESASQTAQHEDDSERQLRIYREALLQGSTMGIRVDAALELLLKKDLAGRDILLSSLRLSDNPSAVRAICRALVGTRIIGKRVDIETLSVFKEPLLSLLAGADEPLGHAAAEAMLVFRFDAIGEELYTLSKDSSLDRRARSNVIYALQVRPEAEAIQMLIQLLDETDGDTARLADSALQEAFGVSIGPGGQRWDAILQDLRQKSLDDIRHERLLRQEMKLRQMQSERDRWQRLYVEALDSRHDAADESSRTALIVDRLGSDLEPVRLWALDKIDRYPSNGQSAMRQKLLGLLSDESRAVRLKTARVLNNMSALNPAEKLLERWHLEEDEGVALAIFEALGEACFFAFSPGSNIELPEMIKFETLEIAERYLSKDEVETAKKGAEIVRKLLELDGFADEQATHYLEALAQRYKVSVERNSPLRGDMLGMMARLCERGAQRERAGPLYRPYFVEAVAVADNPAVRLAAARGLSYLDKSHALKLFREHELVRTTSATLRQLVIDAAHVAGEPQDLEWLAESLGSDSHAESAAEAFLAICERADAALASNWAKNLGKSGLQPSLVRNLLQMAEEKALTEENQALLDDVRKRLARWYVREEMSEQLADYVLRLMSEQAYTVDFSSDIEARVLESLIFAGLHDAAVRWVQMYLQRDAIDQESLFVAKLDAYFQSEMAELEDKKGLVEMLAELDEEADDSLWSAAVQRWKEQVEIESVDSIAGQEGPKEP